MNSANEKKLAARATVLGKSAESGALTELITLTCSESPLVRRLAASGIGKLADIVDATIAVHAIHPLLQDEHPQVRQYSAKALGAFGANAKVALQDLRDLYSNPMERDYVKRSVLTAGKRIRTATDIAERYVVHACQRCSMQVNPDEYTRSMQAFDRPFCDKCFDETYLIRRNFDTKVELHKTITTRDGSLVQSHGERMIADFLSDNDVEYRYDERIRIIQGLAIRPDFYLPEHDLYIEYWGMNTIDYKVAMLKKKQLYQQEGKKLVSIHYKDMPRFIETLREKLGRYLQLRNDSANPS